MLLEPSLDYRIPPQPGSTGDIPTVDFSEITPTDRVGSGRFAVVREATVTDDRVDRIVVKQPDEEHTVTRGDIETFTEEADQWEQVDNHPYIATVYGSGSRPYPWIAVEYLEGGDLADRLRVDDPLKALWIGTCIADALQHAHHMGVAHRDLSPSNVLFKQVNDDRWAVPKVVDWGLATALGESNEPDGFTPGYAAPEQRTAGSRSVGVLTDVYQLGALVYALLTGRPPNETRSHSTTVEDSPVTPPSELRPSLPGTVDTVVLDALDTRPGDRIQTAAQFGEACADCFRNLTTDDTRGTVDRESEPTRPVHDSPTTVRIADPGENDTPEETSQVESTDDPNTEDEGSHWFAPTSYPEVSAESERGFGEAIRDIDRKTSDSDESLGDTLAAVSGRAGRESTLANQIRTIHEEM